MELLYTLLKSRLKLLIIAVFLALLSITLYLFHLQVTLKNSFFSLGQQNFLRYEQIKSPRGNIVDVAGRLLATNRPVTTIYWCGTGEKKLTAAQVHLCQQLVTILQLPDSFLEAMALAEKQGKKIQLAYDVSFEQLSKLSEQFPTHKNIGVERLFKRFYPYKSIASHLVGYLGDIEAQGKMGLERICNDSLKGTSGEVIKTINSLGRHLQSHEMKKALVGETIQATLNIDLQLLAERVFPHDYAGSCIVLDPTTGALEVLVSRPSFDPNIFLTTIGEEAWRLLQEQTCFINRAFDASYPPASLFKLVTLSAALETHLIEQSTCWNCRGSLLFAGRPYYCKKREGHGIVDVEQALTHSCNIPFYDMGKRIKIDTLADYAHRLGLGAKTDVLFKEQTGLIPTTQWKRLFKKERWWPGETLSAAIGQSFILVTPIQVACMISALCEGYLVRPRVLMQEAIIKQPLYISSPTVQFLKKSMKSVISHGTGRSLNKLADFEIYGKTGTAQTSALGKAHLGKKYLEHAWFVAYFTYKNQSPKTLVIFIENTGTSSAATALGYRFLKAYSTFIDNTITSQAAAPAA